MIGIGAGFLAGILLAYVFSVYVLVRWPALLEFSQAHTEVSGQIREKTFITIMMVVFTGGSLLLGLTAGVVFNWLGAQAFHYVAFGAALLLSALAVVSKTELAGDKIFWNIAVGGLLGLVIPLIAS